jgi:phosphopantothenoylcysteine decarboxylase/phosphopantothenate--cysteine ligase
VGLAFVVANDAAVMGEDETTASIVDGDAVQEFQGSKMGLGLRVADELAARVTE